jgi:hypothetical protein
LSLVLARLDFIVLGALTEVDARHALAREWRG